ncbi:hypothetical protein D3C78_1405210 [compost metagenome]
MKSFNLKIHTAFLGMLSASILFVSCEKSQLVSGDSDANLKTEAGTGTKKVLVIGIDGCRQDVMMSANTPNLHSLLTNAVSS